MLIILPVMNCDDLDRAVQTIIPALNRFEIKPGHRLVMVAASNLEDEINGRHEGEHTLGLGREAWRQFDEFDIIYSTNSPENEVVLRNRLFYRAARWASDRATPWLWMETREGCVPLQDGWIDTLEMEHRVAPGQQPVLASMNRDNEDSWPSCAVYPGGLLGASPSARSLGTKPFEKTICYEMKQRCGVTETDRIGDPDHLTDRTMVGFGLSDRQIARAMRQPRDVDTVLNTELKAEMFEDESELNSMAETLDEIKAEVEGNLENLRDRFERLKMRLGEVEGIKVSMGLVEPKKPAESDLEAFTEEAAVVEVSEDDNAKDQPRT